MIYSASERQGATIWLLVLTWSLPVGDVYVVTALQSVLQEDGKLPGGRCKQQVMVGQFLFRVRETQRVALKKLESTDTCGKYKEGLLHKSTNNGAFIIFLFNIY